MGWAHLQSPWSWGLGAKPPEAESLFAFGRLIVQYFAVFIRLSDDKCMKHLKYEVFYTADEFAKGGPKFHQGAGPPGPSAGAGAELTFC